MDHKFGPRFLEKYELVRKLGQGGMGAVYLARHRTLARLVAVKSMLRLDERQRRLFKREGQALARLVHPRIVAVHDADEDGVPYLTCEYVEGTSLRGLMDEGPLEPRRAVKLVAQVLEALAYSHEEGVIHRDIKPENILITEDGEAKVTDFGLAQIHRDSVQNPVSTPGLVAGTPAYMPPEQARGQVCTTASDIYSTGMMLYELLAGDLPFRAPSSPDVLVRQLEEDADDAGKPRVGMSIELAAVVTRALARDPAQRWPSASAFREALLAACGMADEASALGAKAASHDARAPGPAASNPPAARATEPQISHSATTAGGTRSQQQAPPLVRAIVIMCAAMFSMYAFQPADPPPAPSSAAAAASTAGSWRYTFVYLGESVTMKLTLAPSGRYVTEANDPYPYKREEGTITFTGDRFELRADSGRSDTGTFAVTPETLRFRTPAYDVVYTRVHPVSR